MTWAIATQTGRTQLTSKYLEDWLLDGMGLLVQGILIPLLQATLVYSFYRHVLPIPPGYFKVSPVLAFLLSFVLVDYLYYWNHHLLHSQVLWPVHQVHHTVTQMDVLGTSRNTLWTSFLIIYLWIHPLFFYMLSDSTAYLLGVSLTSALDLWRHSSATISSKSWIYRCLCPWLILPQDHTWHHSSEATHCNYGANLKLWDRLHKTYVGSNTLPSTLGIVTPITLAQKLLFPFP
jgi:sterol desaturase/sphingolipid hydroxylase (fatty acid hydroxylase superfamily)